MKYENYIVNIFLTKCKRIKSFFAENAISNGDITSNSMMLMPPASIYARTVGCYIRFGRRGFCE